MSQAPVTFSFRRRAVARLLGWLAWLAAPVVVAVLIRKHPGRRIELSESDRAVLARFFSRDLLDSLVLICVDGIQPPRWPNSRAARLLGFSDRSILSSVAGITLGRVVLIDVASGPHNRSNHSASPELQDRQAFRSLVFHELVHVAQYRRLGMRGFFMWYVRGWTLAGYDYFAIPLEQQAYGLQGRFIERPGENFSVEEEVDREI